MKGNIHSLFIGRWVDGNIDKKKKTEIETERFTDIHTYRANAKRMRNKGNTL